MFVPVKSCATDERDFSTFTSWLSLQILCTKCLKQPTVLVNPYFPKLSLDGRIYIA